MDSQSTQNTGMAFVNSNSREIRRRLRAVARTESVTLRDLVVNIDFQVDAAKGDFTVATVHQLRNRTFLPATCIDHLHGNVVMEENVQSIMTQLEITRDTLQPNMLLIIVRDFTGSCAICRCQLRACEGTPFFSDELLSMSDAEVEAEDRRITLASMSLNA